MPSFNVFTRLGAKDKASKIFRKTYASCVLAMRKIKVNIDGCKIISEELEKRTKVKK